MKIGIDARLIRETGVGRYIRNLIRELAALDNENSYVVYLTRESYPSFELPNTRWQKQLADVRWHTVAEQFVMPYLYLKDRLDLVHVPYYSMPVLYPGKFVATIHDLIIMHTDTGMASTLPWFLYKLRRLGYGLVMRLGARRAVRLIAVSESTKRDIVESLGIPEHKIAVTYEGVDRGLVSRPETKRLLAAPYILYVGNAYPHKNLNALIGAFLRFRRSSADYRNYVLMLVGRRDYFYGRLEDKVKNSGCTDIRFFGEADDRQLASLYANAAGFVFPSRMEGFGLPALEALSLGCPVLCSDIPVFREILGDTVEYADTLDEGKTAAAIERLAATGKRSMHGKASIIKSLLSRYSWTDMAERSLELYRGTVA